LPPFSPLDISDVFSLAVKFLSSSFPFPPLLQCSVFYFCVRSSAPSLWFSRVPTSQHGDPPPPPPPGVFPPPLPVGFPRMSVPPLFHGRTICLAQPHCAFWSMFPQRCHQFPYQPFFLMQLLFFSERQALPLGVVPSPVPPPRGLGFFFDVFFSPVVAMRIVCKLHWKNALCSMFLGWLFGRTCSICRPLHRTGCLARFDRLIRLQREMAPELLPAEGGLV